MGNILAIFKKQCKDLVKNKTVLIQFIMFPALTLVMSRMVKMDGMPENFFVGLFATMYIGMAPLASMAAILSEEKEKNTLRVLLMSNVKPQEYLFGIGIYLWLFCMIGAGVICAAGSYGLRERVLFMSVMAVGISLSLLAGAAIGILSKTQMMATSIALPTMMVFSFLPMLSMFQEKVAKVAKFLYSGQVHIAINQISSPRFEMGNLCITLANLILFFALFVVAYRKHGLE